MNILTISEYTKLSYELKINLIELN